MKNRMITMLAVAFFSAAMVLTPGCKKDTPPPAAYNPSFSATALPYNVGGIDYLSFMLTCTTDDIEVIKVELSGPGGSYSDTYTGNGSLFLRNEPMTLSSDYPKLLGTWTFTVTGNIKSGTHSGESFYGTTTVNVTGK